MFFIKIPLSHDTDYYCEKIDEHIKEDFETKIPDYGAEAFNPIGFHFKRKNNRISGIYRSKNAKNAANAFISQSTHMHFAGKMKEDTKGNRVLSVFLYPQLSQIFILIVTLVFPLLLMKNFIDTYIYVLFFAVVFLYSLGETIKLSLLVKKEFMKFFE